MEYLRFWIATLAFIIGVAISFVLGGVWMWYGVAFIVFIGMGVDLLLGKKANDISEPEYKHSWIFEVLNRHPPDGRRFQAQTARFWLIAQS